MKPAAGRPGAGQREGGMGARLLPETEVPGGLSAFLGDVAKAAPAETLGPGGAGGGAACP